MKKIKFTKNNMNFTVVFQSWNVANLECDFGEAGLNITYLEPASAFIWSNININGKDIKGIQFPDDIFETIATTREALKKEAVTKIINFFNQEDLQVELTGYTHYSVNGNGKELLDTDLFYEYEKRFIEENKKFFVEISNTQKAYESPVVLFSIAKEVEIVEVEKVRELTKEESLNYKENDKIGNLTVKGYIRTVDDIDYGKMGKCFMWAVEEKKQTIQRAQFS